MNLNSDQEFIQPDHFLDPKLTWNKPVANYLLGEYPTIPDQRYSRTTVRMELGLETALEGDRFFDLVRWEIDNQVISQFIKNDSEFRVLSHRSNNNPDRNNHWPIPQKSLNREK